MKYIITIVLLLLALPVTALANQTTLTGTVTHVRDGDTIEVGKIPIRLSGVSAPELDEQLGKLSKTFMKSLVLGKAVTCELDGSKSYDRYVGRCYLDKVDIGISVIEAGLARDCPRFSGGRYKQHENKDALKVIKLPSYCR